MKIGLIICQYNEKDFIEKCLNPWINFKKNNGKHELLIVCLDGCFAGFEQRNGSNLSTDGSLEILNKFKQSGDIDNLEFFPNNETEHDARNIGLGWLKAIGSELIVSWGIDEIATEEEIVKIFNFVEKNSLINVFHVNYKNYFRTEKCWIDGFCPRRIWRVASSGLLLNRFNYDDDAIFVNREGQTIQDTQTATKIIPKAVVHCRHLTWLNGNRSKRKISYQQKRWGENGCSYKYDEEKNEVCFNSEYYKKTGQNVPELNYE